MITQEKQIKKTTDLSDYLETMMLMLSTELRGKYVREFKFHPKRKWRFDFAFPEAMVAVEADGGEYCQNGGRHASSSDYEKINQAIGVNEPQRIIHAIDKKIMINCHSLITFINGTYINLINTDIAAIFGTNAKKLVTEVGAPS